MSRSPTGSCAVAPRASWPTSSAARATRRPRGCSTPPTRRSRRRPHGPRRPRSRSRQGAPAGGRGSLRDALGHPRSRPGAHRGAPAASGGVLLSGLVTADWEEADMPLRVRTLRAGSVALLALALTVSRRGRARPGGTTITFLTPPWGVPPDQALLDAFEAESGITVEVQDAGQMETPVHRRPGRGGCRPARRRRHLPDRGGAVQHRRHGQRRAARRPHRGCGHGPERLRASRLLAARRCPRRASRSTASS